MRLKSALRRGVAAAVIAGIVVSSGIPAYADPVGHRRRRHHRESGRATEAETVTRSQQGETEFDKDDTDTVITGESDKSEEHTVTIDTSKGDVDVTFDDLKIDVSGKAEGDVSGDGPAQESKAAVTVQGDHDATIELDGDNELKSGSYNAGLEKNKQESKGTLTIKDDKGKDGSLTAEGGERRRRHRRRHREHWQQHHHPGRHHRGCGREQRGRHRRRCRPRVGRHRRPEPGRPLHLRRRRGDGQGGEPDDGRQGPGHRRKVRRSTHG